MRIKNPIQKVRQQAGVTLIEMLVSMAVFGLLFVTIYTGIAMGFSVINSARENLRATQVMVEKMETIRLYTFKQINTPGFIPTTFSEDYLPKAGDGTAVQSTSSSGLVYNGRITIEDSGLSRTYKDYIKRVTIDISWVSGGRSHNRSMSTFVTRHGLQKYVY